MDFFLLKLTCIESLKTIKTIKTAVAPSKTKKKVILKELLLTKSSFQTKKKWNEMTFKFLYKKKLPQGQKSIQNDFNLSKIGRTVVEIWSFNWPIFAGNDRFIETYR